MDFSDDSDGFESERDVVQPYMYEPVIDTQTNSEDSANDTDSSSESDRDEPLSENVDSWCECGMCVPMPTAPERKCCQSTNIVNDKLEAEELLCITDHEGFQVNCLNIHVLETSYYEYVHNHGLIEEGQLIHELYRYLAYRRFSRWVYGLLPKKCRRVIPACAVHAIRKRFPSEEYSGFKYPQ